MIVILMGVTGTGKTTAGHLLVAKTGWEFAEGDEFHSPANLAKLQAGTPLTDEDRAPWLASLHAQIVEWDSRGANALLTCSALKQQYRNILAGDLPPGHVRFVVLEAPKGVIQERLERRKGHFMNPKLLDSQLATLEDPKDALHVEVDRSPEEVVGDILHGLGIQPEAAQ